MIISFDIAYTVCFFIYIAYVKFKLKKESRACLKENVNTADYAVQVTGLPKETKIKKESLAKYFNDLGFKVHDVHIARKYGGLLSDMKSLDNINKKIKKREVILTIEAQSEGEDPSKVIRQDDKLSELR